MSTSKIRQYHHGNLREALIDAAIDILAENPASDIGLREVARKAGVSAAAPYRHFNSREALVSAIAARGFTLLADTLEHAKAKDLKAIGHAYIQFALNHRNLFGLMLKGAPQAQTPEFTEAAAKAYSPLAQAISSGPEGTSRLKAAAAWALVHGLATLISEQQLHPDLLEENTQSELIDTALSIFGRGLQT